MYRVLQPFEFSEPTTVAEAAALVDGDRTRVLAGGVDLVLKMRLRQIVPDRVVSLRNIPSLAYVRPDTRLGSGAVRIGALATLRQVGTAAVVLQGWPLLAEAIGSIVSVQTKAMGTLVGNLCVGTPASDVAPALYALGARVRLAGTEGAREIPIEEFFLAAGSTAVRPHEIVTEVVVPAPAAGSAGAFLKLSKTAEDIAKVNVAVMVALADGICTYVRMAIGSAAPTPLRALAAEEALAGRPFDGPAVRQAADSAAAAVCPISDARSTAAYRADMVRVLIRDALERAGARAVAGAGAGARAGADAPVAEEPAPPGAALADGKEG
jgi:CO/xanthine dehydrogenase FAD-binding subunit